MALAGTFLRMISGLLELPLQQCFERGEKYGEGDGSGVGIACRQARQVAEGSCAKTRKVGSKARC